MEVRKYILPEFNAEVFALNDEVDFELGNETEFDFSLR